MLDFSRGTSDLHNEITQERCLHLSVVRFLTSKRINNPFLITFLFLSKTYILYKKVKNNNKRERIESIERIEDFKIEHGSFEKVQSSDSCTVNFPVIMQVYVL